MKVSLYTNWFCWKQRPHHLADYLALQGHKLSIYSLRSIRSSGPPMPSGVTKNVTTLFPRRLDFFGSVNVLNNIKKNNLIESFYNNNDYIKIYAGPPTVSMNKKPSSFFIYDCLDDWSGLISASSGYKDIETRLLNNADMIWVVSKKLYQDLMPIFGNKLLYVPNGVCFTDFSHVRVDKGTNKDRPVLGYVGAIDSWFDLNLVHELHECLSEWEIHLIGPVRTDISPILGLSRIKIFGLVPYVDLPNYITQFDVAMIPFLINPLTEATSPIKLFEYLAAGLPVVSTFMPEVKPFIEDGVVGCGSSAEDFASIAKRLFNNCNVNKCQEIAMANSWSEIFNKALNDSLNINYVNP